MVLVDTSVWVDHLRGGQSGLTALLNEGDVICHPFIIGELACGGLKNRDEIVSLLKALPVSVVAEHDEVMKFIDDHKLMNLGLGYIDINLLVSALLTGVAIWTLDKKLEEISKQFGIFFQQQKRHGTPPGANQSGYQKG